ncbi:PIG-X [Mycena filopes]|nr:PIG-X [Mycena filopes]
MQSSSSLLHPESFHPVFSTRIAAQSLLNCSLHLHYALPRMLFVDPFELTNRAAEYTFKYAGPSNLELPVAALDEDEDDVALLLTVAQPLPPDGGVLEMEVPLHVRYGPAAPNTSFTLTELPWPAVFLACPTETLKSTTPLPPMPHAFTLPFAGMRITHLPPPPGAVPTELIRTPVGDTADVARVELGTALVVLLAFVYLVRATWRTMTRRGGVLLSVKEE